MTSTADACEVSATEADSGTVRFAVTNAGDDVTEFYLLGDDGLRVISEVENVGPGLTRDLVVAGQARHVLHGVQARAWSATASAPSSP